MKNSVDWILDTGATHHLVNNRDLISAETGRSFRINAVGGAVAQPGTEVHLKPNSLGIRKAIFHKNLRQNLLSVGKLCDSGAEIKFFGNTARLNLKDGETLRLSKQNGLWRLKAKVGAFQNEPTQNAEILRAKANKVVKKTDKKPQKTNKTKQTKRDEKNKQEKAEENTKTNKTDADKKTTKNPMTKCEGHYGPMWSGKSKNLNKAIEEYGLKNCELFRPTQDNRPPREHEKDVKKHYKPVEKIADITDALKTKTDKHTVIIDEAHMFAGNTENAWRELITSFPEKNFFVAGLEKGLELTTFPWLIAFKALESGSTSSRRRISTHRHYSRCDECSSAWGTISVRSDFKSVAEIAKQNDWAGGIGKTKYKSLCRKCHDNYQIEFVERATAGVSNTKTKTAAKSKDPDGVATQKAKVPEKDSKTAKENFDPDTDANREFVEDLKKQSAAVPNDILHERICHFWNTYLRRPPACASCAMHKGQKKSHKKERPEFLLPEEYLDSLHVDLVGPFPEPIGSGGERFLFTCVDDKVGFLFVDGIKLKTDAWEALENAISEFGGRPKRLRRDNGEEFLTPEWKKVIKGTGGKNSKPIKEECSAAGEPEQNGKIERHNRTVQDGFRATCEGCDPRLWLHAAKTASYVWNLLPKKGKKSPRQLRDEAQGRKIRPIRTGHLRVFGCEAYYKLGRRTKIQERNRKGVFVGYKGSSYLILHHTPKGRWELVQSWTVTFFESKKVKNLDEYVAEGKARVQNFRDVGYTGALPSTYELKTRGRPKGSKNKPKESDQEKTEGAPSQKKTAATATSKDAAKTSAETKRKSAAQKKTDFQKERPAPAQDKKKPEPKAQPKKTGRAADKRKAKANFKKKIQDKVQNKLQQQAKAVAITKEKVANAKRPEPKKTPAPKAKAKALPTKEARNSKSKPELPVTLKGTACPKAKPSAPNKKAEREKELRVWAKERRPSASPPDSKKRKTQPENITALMMEAVEWLKNAEATEAPTDEKTDKVIDAMLTEAAEWFEKNDDTGVAETFVTMVKAKEAEHGPKRAIWLESAKKELNSLLEKKTWISVKLKDIPKDAQVLPIILIYTLKDNGVHKCRAVVLGNQQSPTAEDTFSPVVAHATLRWVIHIAALLDLDIVGFDISSAFVNAPVNSDVYCKLPEAWGGGYAKPQKALYGLRQAPRCWSRHFTASLQKIGFTQSSADPGLYFAHGKNGPVMLLVYVDDGIIVGDREDCLLYRKQILTEYKGREEPLEKAGKYEKLTYVGLEIIRDRAQRKAWVQQTCLINKLEKRFEKFLDNKNADYGSSGMRTPITKNLSPDSPPTTFPIRMAVGSLMYLGQGSRPDLCYSIKELSRFLENPTTEAAKTAIRAIKYVIRTKNLGLVLGNVKGVLPNDTYLPVEEAYSDADYASEIGKRRSTTGNYYVVDGAPVWWQCVLQKCIATSTCESEYYAAFEMTRRICWLRKISADLRKFFKVPDTHPKTVKLWVDNQSTICVLRSDLPTKRTKHFEVKLSFVSEKVEKGVIEIDYVESEKNLADPLTKPKSYEVLLKLGLEDAPKV
jgi:thymidine kinase